MKIENFLPGCEYDGESAEHSEEIDMVFDPQRIGEALERLQQADE